MTGHPRVAVDRDLCIGAGHCVLAAPEVFDQDDEGLVAVLDEDALEAPDDSVRAAAQRCPSGALSLRE